MRINQFVNKFYQDIKNVLIREKLKENLKLPIYVYIVSYILGIIAIIAITFLKPEIPGKSFDLEKLGWSTSLPWSYIIINNTRAIIVIFISGIVLYIGPIFFLGMNGFFQGLFLAGYMQWMGAAGLAKYLILFIPHALFEVPALLFSAGAGIILSKELLSLITLRLISKSRLYEAFLLLFIAFCLILIASVVETQVTFRIAKILQQ